MMELGVWVHCTKISAEFEFQGQPCFLGPHPSKMLQIIPFAELNNGWVGMASVHMDVSN